MTHERVQVFLRDDPEEGITGVAVIVDGVSVHPDNVTVEAILPDGEVTSKRVLVPVKELEDTQKALELAARLLDEAKADRKHGNR